MGGGAGSAIPRGGAAVPRGRDPAASDPRARAPARHAGAAGRRALGRRGRRHAGRPGRGRGGRRVLQPVVPRADPSGPGRAIDPRALSRRGFALAILSNWPLASTIDRFAEAQGWTPLPPRDRRLAARRHDQAAPGDLPGRGGSARACARQDRTPAILHVGDDWAADVVGASEAGWRTAYLRDRQHDTPLPTSERGTDTGGGAAVVADLEIDELSELDALVDLAGT